MCRKGDTMLDDFISRNIDKLCSVFVAGEFHIGIAPIKEYVKFYIISQYIQKEFANETISVLKYAEENFIDTDDIDENDDDGPEKLERKRWNFYERKLDHYNTLNFEKKNDLKKRIREEKLAKTLHGKEKNRKGNIIRYQGNEIHRFQLSEFRMLDDIKEGKDAGFNSNKTYKRIISDKGYINKINFRELQDFIDVLSQEIDKSGDEYKNIRYYKLEKRLNFELIKSVLKALHNCKEKQETDNAILDDLVILFKLPLIKERQIYANIYPELNYSERMRWRIEIDGVFRFIQYAITVCESLLKNKNIDEIIKPELEGFKNIYMDFSYRNDYKIRKDFTAENFLSLMKKFDDINVKTYNLINNELDK